MMDFSSLDKLSTDTLFELNRQIVTLIRHRRSTEKAAAACAINIGDEVTFKGRGGRMVHATVMKINRTTVICAERSEAGAINWKVSASMLKVVNRKEKLKPFVPGQGGDRPNTAAMAW